MAVQPVKKDLVAVPLNQRYREPAIPQNTALVPTKEGELSRIPIGHQLAICCMKLDKLEDMLHAAYGQLSSLL